MNIVCWCVLYMSFFIHLLYLYYFFFYFFLDQFLHLHKCDPDSCAEAEVSGNGWQWYKPLHVRPEMHTQSKEQHFNIKVSMLDSQTIVEYLWISFTHATKIMHYCHVEIYKLQGFFWHHEQVFFTCAVCFQAAFIYSHHSWWSLCILVGDWPSLLFSWSLCLACTTWYLPSCQRTLEKMLVTFLNLAWARFRCAQPTVYEIHIPMLITCGTVWCTMLCDNIIYINYKLKCTYNAIF